jgi:hypothetical protein
VRHAGLLTILVLFCILSGQRAYAVPPVISYQGKLTMPGGTPVGTTVTLTFTFYDAQTGGNQLGAGFTDSDGVVPDSHGVCSTLVGDDPGNPIPADVFAGDSVWLNVAVNGENLSSRMQISSVGYALRADAAASATQAMQVPAEGQVDGAAIKSGLVAESHIDPVIARDSELAGAFAGVYTKATADDRFVQRVGSAYVVVPTTSSAVQNGLNLLAAYAQAKSLTPNGMPRSATNRVAVIVPPGQYNLLASQILMDAEFVDLIGLSSARGDQCIVSDSSVVGSGFGLLRQTANDVRIHNLRVHCKRGMNGLQRDANDPATYFPDSGTTDTQVVNCEFRGTGPVMWSPPSGDPIWGGCWSMRLGITYAGTYTDCFASAEPDPAFNLGPYTGWYAFGGRGGTASGTFTNCSGGEMSFGDGGTACGIFTNCKGGVSFGHHGTASGSFINCTGTYESFGGDYGIASGTFANCTGASWSFGGLGGTASGTFIDCRGDDSTFGGSGTASGAFYSCIGGDHAFGGAGGDATGGRFFHCTGGADSFTTSGSPTLLYCVRSAAAFP